MFDVSKYITDSFKKIRLFLVSINSNQVLLLLIFIFLFHSQYFCRYVHFHQFLLRVFSHKNINQFSNLRHYIALACFLLQINYLFSVALIVLWLRWHHILWILILLLFFVQQPMIDLVANSLCIQIMLGCFFVHLLIHIYVFYGKKDTVL